MYFGKYAVCLKSSSTYSIPVTILFHRPVPVGSIHTARQRCTSSPLKKLAGPHIRWRKRKLHELRKYGCSRYKMIYHQRRRSVEPGASSFSKPSLSECAFRKNEKSLSGFKESFHRKRHQVCFDPLGESAMSAVVLPQIRQLPRRTAGRRTAEGRSEMQNTK